ncbi:type II secretion system F family protein [Paenibacillus pasadenensis]|uniref:type II secretion system F family protein n=1 Tax=Paenibacillus pasadenensis TaxID=217090 RepID=UPI00203BDB68|nr:type II secretion system F family protein [Paenibacillus pasadenensis]MCM3749688.1 type II secretion system F family protein [Paenibacillus pasadenensis]
MRLIESKLAGLGWPSKEANDLKESRYGTDYQEFQLSRAQFLAAFGAGAGVLFTAFYLFYLNVPAALVLSLLALRTPNLYRNYARRRRQERLKLHFKEMLFSLTSSLAAGRSVENALFASLDDLKLMYPGSRTDLMDELERIRHRCANGETLESGLMDFALRSGVDEIRQFTDVFTICKRTGGDLVEIIRRSSQQIGERIEVNQEIDVLIARKRFESRIMLMVPFLFLGFLHAAAPDYMAPLYASAIGYALLTIALILFAFCAWVMMKMMNIRL